DFEERSACEDLFDLACQRFDLAFRSIEVGRNDRRSVQIEHDLPIWIAGLHDLPRVVLRPVRIEERPDRRRYARLELVEEWPAEHFTHVIAPHRVCLPERDFSLSL